jgi:RNA polymerase subunit RPABC4/transcription elongation factor Spt4
VYWAEWKVRICRECKYLMEYNDCIPYFVSD